MTNPVKKGCFTHHSCHTPTCKGEKGAQLCAGHPLVTETLVSQGSKSYLRSRNAHCTKGQSPSYRVELSQQAGCRQRAELLASWTPHAVPSQSPSQEAKAKEEVLVKKLWCAGPVRCGQSSPGEQNPNCGKSQSCPKHNKMEPGVQFPSASSMTHQEGPCCLQALWPCGDQAGRPAANSPAADHPSLSITVPFWWWGKGPQQELPLFVLQGLESRGVSNNGTDTLITQAACLVS